ncbi:MAG: four helix bundle protein [Thermodesulfobacteriota bacterium]
MKNFGIWFWNMVIEWDYFAKDTVGKQLIKAADSVAANLSEGFGRFYFKENKQFCYYRRGSLLETKTWLKKAHERGLINGENFKALNDDIEKLSIKLNNYIKSIGKQISMKLQNDNK